MNTGNETQFIETDVLILGGGLAGCFAAMKASEHDVKVTIIEKNYLPYSGSNASGIDHFPYCFIPEVHGREGFTIEDFVKIHTFIGSLGHLYLRHSNLFRVSKFGFRISRHPKICQLYPMGRYFNLSLNGAKFGRRGTTRFRRRPP